MYNPTQPPPEPNTGIDMDRFLADILRGGAALTPEMTAKRVAEIRKEKAARTLADAILYPQDYSLNQFKDTANPEAGKGGPWDTRPAAVTAPSGPRQARGTTLGRPPMPGGNGEDPLPVADVGHNVPSIDLMAPLSLARIDAALARGDITPERADFLRRANATTNVPADEPIISDIPPE